MLGALVDDMHTATSSDRRFSGISIPKSNFDRECHARAWRDLLPITLSQARVEAVVKRPGRYGQRPDDQAEAGLTTQVLC